MIDLLRFDFRDEQDYRRHLAEVVKRFGYFAYSLMQGEGSVGYRFSEDDIERYACAIAAICRELLEQGLVTSTRQLRALPPEADAAFQRFIVGVTGEGWRAESARADKRRRARLSAATKASWRRRKRRS